MRRWWWVLPIFVAAAAGLMAVSLGWFGASSTGPEPRSVPAGDQEIAWLHNPTSFETWENFVWGVKRAEMASPDGPAGLVVDDSGAFPTRTTTVPEIVVRRNGHSGSLRIRWYKVADNATQEAWVGALAARDPAPLAILGGWSSDRAKELADAMRDTSWPGPKPLLFMATATADSVYSADDSPLSGPGPSLVAIYDRSFRFCFTNRQMAEAVTDFVVSDPTLRPGSVPWPGLRSVGAAIGPWSALAALAAEAEAMTDPLPGFAIEWQDDPYSTDLSLRFRTKLLARSVPAAALPRLDIVRFQIPFSTGRLNRPNRAEAEAAEQILSNLPPPGKRTVLVIPTVSAPARRTLRTLVQGNPDVGRRLVALTGDGISVNTFFRDREFAWPMRSIPIPVVLFTHADPFAWDSPGAGPSPPPGYELAPPAPGAVRSSTEDIQSFTRLTRIAATAAFRDGSNGMETNPDAVAATLRAHQPGWFDEVGNRLSRKGEYVVVLRPAYHGREGNEHSHADAALEVYTRRPGEDGWERIHSRSLGGLEGGKGE